MVAISATNSATPSVQPSGRIDKSQLKGRKSEVPSKTQDFLLGLYDATREKRTAHGNALKTDTNASSVLNMQGQTTGCIVNLSA